MEMDQRTEEWKKARLGKLTASRMGDALSMLKSGGESARRTNYRLELVAELLTGKPTEFYENAYMRWGNEYEGMARIVYGQRMKELVDEVGFIAHPVLDMAGASPDGLVGEEGLIEIKCPTTQQHITYLTTNVIPEDYQLQMAWQLICTGRKWCDFVSFDPRLADDLCMHVIRYEPDQETLDLIEEKAKAFLESVDSMMKYLDNVARENGGNYARH